MWSLAMILGIINYSLICVSLILFVFVFVLIYQCRQELHNVSFLLTCNTCISSSLTSLTSCLMLSSNLFGDYLSNHLKIACVLGLFYDIFECSIYHSYSLQSFYRLCRVIFYKKKSLLSYILYMKLIIVQWLLVVIFLFFPLLLNWYIRLPSETFCLIPYNYIGPEIYHILILYLIPLISIIVTYIWITIYLRQFSRIGSLHLIQLRRRRNERDLIILKRIIISVSILIILRFPTIIFLIYGIINGELHPLTYSIVGLITSICLILIALMIISITPQLRRQINHFFHWTNNQIHIQPTQ